MTWFQDNNGDGIVFPEYFTPIPTRAIALVLTAVRIGPTRGFTAMDPDDCTRCCQIECCIDEWTDGTRKASNWNEGRYKNVYHSHISSLNELRNHPQGGTLLTQIQYNLLKDAR